MVDGTGAWIITGGTETGVRQFVGQAVRDHMLQSGNYEQKLVVIGIAALGPTANNEVISRGSSSIEKARLEVLQRVPFVRSLRAGVQLTLDPSSETFISVQCASPGR